MSDSAPNKDGVPGLKFDYPGHEYDNYVLQRDPSVVWKMTNGNVIFENLVLPSQNFIIKIKA